MNNTLKELENQQNEISRQIKQAYANMNVFAVVQLSLKRQKILKEWEREVVRLENCKEK